MYEGKVTEVMSSYRGYPFGESGLVKIDMMGGL
jgi:hypothetical protein